MSKRLGEVSEKDILRYLRSMAAIEDFFQALAEKKPREKIIVQQVRPML